MSEELERHSEALEAELVADPNEKAKVEARNGVRQFDAVTELIEYFSDPEHKFKLRPSQLLHLHRIALDGLSSYAGNWRPAESKSRAASINRLVRTLSQKRSNTCVTM